MALIEISNFSFAYPGGAWVLDGVSLSIESGAFCVISGPSGCGKTTLLRSLKPELAPVGTRKGSISLDGREIVRNGDAVAGFAQQESAQLIGFVQQDPDAQLVCDAVWHELAFGLENIGMSQEDMRRRVAEVAHFFGIAPWVRKNVEQLSGGQKQLVNLAGSLALRPRVLLLDEPTAQLDPHARRQFMSLLAHVNRSLGITVVMSTHAPEDVADFATQQVQLGPVASMASWEDVRAFVEAAPLEDAEASAGHKVLGLDEGQRSKKPSSRQKASPCIDVRQAYFRYGKTDDWVLRGMDMRVQRGGVHAIVGGNGCGKSTLLKLMAGVAKPQRGTVKNACSANQALLPQDPKALFVCDTVAEELAEWRAVAGYSAADEQAILCRFGLAGHEGQHPYDLSGGQQQKLALAKLLLCRPELLFLDEPTKGLDAVSCAETAHIVRSLSHEGKTIVLVTHDLDFAYAVADVVSMIFDGEASCTQPAKDFFADNLVYKPRRQSRFYGAFISQCATREAMGRSGVRA